MKLMLTCKSHTWEGACALEHNSATCCKGTAKPVFHSHHAVFQHFKTFSTKQVSTEAAQQTWILEVVSVNLRFLWSYSVPPGKFQDSTTIRPSLIHSNSSIMWCYTVLILKVSVGNLQTHSAFTLSITYTICSLRDMMVAYTCASRSTTLLHQVEMIQGGQWENTINIYLWSTWICKQLHIKLFVLHLFCLFWDQVDTGEKHKFNTDDLYYNSFKKVHFN
jgi:hypothetical protein